MTDDANDLSTTTTDTQIPPVEGADHPHAGIAEDGWSKPEACARTGRLVVKRGGAETDIAFPLSPPAIIGRFDPAVGPIDVDLAEMPEGQYVSRKHAKIACDGDAWTITDLGSSNGTFVLRDDFERVETAELADGTEIALGNARFVFHLVEVA